VLVQSVSVLPTIAPYICVHRYACANYTSREKQFHEYYVATYRIAETNLDLDQDAARIGEGFYARECLQAIGSEVLKKIRSPF
jgi:hypothetical protein